MQLLNRIRRRIRQHTHHKRIVCESGLSQRLALAGDQQLALITVEMGSLAGRTEEDDACDAAAGEMEGVSCLRLGVECSCDDGFGFVLRHVKR